MGNSEDDSSKGVAGSNSSTPFQDPNGPIIELGVDHAERHRRNLPRLVRRGQGPVNLALFQTPMLLDPFAGLQSPVTRSEPDLNAWPGSERRPERAVLVKKSNVEASACTLRPVETFRFKVQKTEHERRLGSEVINIPGGVESPEVLSMAEDGLYPLLPLARPVSLAPGLGDGIAPRQVYPSSPALSRHSSILYGEYHKPRQSIRDRREQQIQDGVDLSKRIPRLENPATCCTSCCEHTPEYDWYSPYGKGCCWVTLLVVFYVLFGPLILVALGVAMCFMAVTCQCEKLMQ